MMVTTKINLFTLDKSQRKIVVGNMDWGCRKKLKKYDFII